MPPPSFDVRKSHVESRDLVEVLCNSQTALERTRNKQRTLIQNGHKNTGHLDLSKLSSLTVKRLMPRVDGGNESTRVVNVITYFPKDFATSDTNAQLPRSTDPAHDASRTASIERAGIHVRATDEPAWHRRQVNSACSYNSASRTHSIPFLDLENSAVAPNTTSL